MHCVECEKTRNVPIGAEDESNVDNHHYDILKKILDNEIKKEV